MAQNSQIFTIIRDKSIWECLISERKFKREKEDRQMMPSLRDVLLSRSQKRKKWKTEPCGAERQNPVKN